MMLFEKVSLDKQVTIEDATGKSLPAIDVFAHAIEYLKKDLLSISDKRFTGEGLKDNDVHWVITVPAIWNDAAKQFMREAAVKAGISDNKVAISLEPEAASLYCRHMPLAEVNSANSSLATFQSGKKYMIIDAGGGTVDITMHQITDTGDIRELLNANGGAWGGTTVDDAFEAFIDDMTGKGVMQRFKKCHMDDYIDMFRDFEVKKRAISPANKGKIKFRIPVALVETVKRQTGMTIKDSIQRSKYSGQVTFQKDKLFIEYKIAESLFDGAIRNIIEHLSNLFKKNTIPGCDTIVMVGGFSESSLLQNAVISTFGSMKVIVPAEAGLAVLKGAVIFGHKPTSIVERVLRFTYGEKLSHTYTDSCSHPVGRRTRNKEGIMTCYDNFEIHARKGQSVRLGEEQKECISQPASDTQTSIGTNIYYSTNTNPSLVTEPGCALIGKFVIPIPDTSLGRKRSFGTTFLFGGTEIEVKVIDKATGEEFRKKINFLG